jgi:AcrR family transcriptional regulator
MYGTIVRYDRNVAVADPASRLGLSRERILDAALALFDVEGVDALTMRRLAAELGVGTMTLYGYFRRKEDLLDAIVDRGAERVAAAGSEGPWKQRLRELVLELRRRGRRSLAGTSANRTGEPTITDVDEVIAAFGAHVPLIVDDDFEHVPPERRRSASIVDLTDSTPQLVREGSVPAGPLAQTLERHGLGELVVDRGVRRV